MTLQNSSAICHASSCTVRKVAEWSPSVSPAVVASLVVSVVYRIVYHARSLAVVQAPRGMQASRCGSWGDEVGTGIQLHGGLDLASVRLS